MSWETDATIIGRIQERLYEPPEDDFGCARCDGWAGEDEGFVLGDERTCWDCFWEAFDGADEETRESMAEDNGLSLTACAPEARERLKVGKGR